MRVLVVVGLVVFAAAISAGAALRTHPPPHGALNAAVTGAAGATDATGKGNDAAATAPSPPPAAPGNAKAASPNPGGLAPEQRPVAPLPAGARARFTKRAVVSEGPLHFPVSPPPPPRAAGGGGARRGTPDEFQRPGPLLVYDIASGNEFLVELGAEAPLVAAASPATGPVAATALAEIGERVEEIFGEGTPWNDVADSTVSPYCAIGRLQLGCAGTLITNRLVATAGHCVYDLFGNTATTPPSGAWKTAAQTHFEATRNGATTRPAVAPVLLIVPVGWTTTTATQRTVTRPDGSTYQTYAPNYHTIGSVLYTFDYGFVALASSATPPSCAPLSINPLWAEHTFNQARQLEIVGYPATQGRDGQRMKTDTCDVVAYHQDSNIGGHRCDILPGNSGGPGISNGNNVACLQSTGADADSTGESSASGHQNYCVMVNRFQAITIGPYLTTYA